MQVNESLVSSSINVTNQKLVSEEDGMHVLIEDPKDIYGIIERLKDNHHSVKKRNDD